jgi:hypothetical protein
VNAAKSAQNCPKLPQTISNRQNLPNLPKDKTLK